MDRRQPSRLANLLNPKTAEHKRRISEGLRQYHRKVREALLAQRAREERVRS